MTVEPMISGPRHERVVPAPGCTTCLKFQRILKDQTTSLSRAIRARDEYKRSLEYHDGAAGYWRRVAKSGNELVGRAKGWARDPAVEVALVRHEQLVVEAAARFEQVDRVKLALWDLWRNLPEGDATRTALQQLWGDL